MLSHCLSSLSFLPPRQKKGMDIIWGRGKAKLTGSSERRDPAVEEREAVAGVRAAVHAVVELVLEDRVAVRVGGGVGGHLRDCGVGAAVQVDDEIPVLQEV